MDKLKAYSKVNLILKVFPQEKHEIKHKIHSLFCLYKPLYDDVLIEEANKNLIVFKQEGKVLKIDKTKTILAIEYLSKLLKRSINLRIIINKRIPVMSGLGGSATDIAVIIKWITQKYHFKLTNSHLRYIALNIGSDIPFFLSHYSSAWVSNYGDQVVKNNKPIPKFKIILTNIQTSTVKVYEKMMADYVSQVNVDKAWEALNKKPFSKSVIYNDMWAFANKSNKKLNSLSSKLLITKNIILTGSGGSFVEIN